MPGLPCSQSPAHVEVQADVTTKMVMLLVWLTVVVCGLVPSSVFAQSLSPPQGRVTLPQEPLFTRPSQNEARSDADLSFPGLMRSIGSDFQNFPTRQNMLSLVAGAGLGGLSHSADRSVTASLSSSQGVVTALKPGKVIGGTIVQMGVAFAGYGLGRLTDSPTLTALGAHLVRAQVLTQGITQGIKFATGRARPDGSRLSFPSGHTAASFATGTVLQRHYGWKVGLPAYGLASYVAASRLSENRHYLSDVVFGAVLGVVAGRHVTLSLGKTKFAVAPMAIPGGAGVSFAMIGR